MRLRRRLLVTMIGLVALGLAAVDIITLTSLHSYLYGRVDDQLAAASHQMASYVIRSDARGFALTPDSIGDPRGSGHLRELIDPADHTVGDPSFRHPVRRPTPRRSCRGTHRRMSRTNADIASRADQAYRPSSRARSPSPRSAATDPRTASRPPLCPAATLVVATPLTTVNATLGSLRTIEVAVSLGLLVALLVLMTLLIRQGLRPLEDMAREADAIAAGDLTRRVEPTEGDGEIARLGRALNGMLSQIETAFAQRARSEDRLRSFLADASHELRTPLTSIRGYAELLRKDALDDEEARDRALSRIEKEAARMGSLVGDLAVLAREGEGPEPTRYRVDLAAVAAEAVADAKTIDAHAVHRPPGPGRSSRSSATMPASSRWCTTCSATPWPTRPRAPRSRSAWPCEGEQAVLEVRDHGPGMSPDQARHVFDRFYRGDGDRLDGGSGLGLFIVATLARTFGGTATVDTESGRGATFRVALPVYPPNEVANGNGGGSRQDAGHH